MPDDYECDSESQETVDNEVGYADNHCVACTFYMLAHARKIYADSRV